jgi:hypothetical protein
MPAAAPVPGRENLDRVSRRRAIPAAVLLAAVAAVLVSGCQPRLGAAALVGDQRISDDQLQTLVRDALASPGVRDALPQSAYKGDLAAYRRAVLNMEVELALAKVAAGRLEIGVDEGKVGERYRSFERQHGSATQFAADLAASDALTPRLFRDALRIQVIESDIGYRAGGVQRPTEAELRRLFEQSAEANTTATLTLVQVPDLAAAQAALARVQQDPAALDAVAKQYAKLQQGPTTPQQAMLSRLPADLGAKLPTLKSGDVFTYTLTAAGAPTYYLIRFGGIQRPTFESSRPQLENQSVLDAAKAGHDYLAKFAKQVGVQVNPRYGAWNGDQLSIVDYTNPAVRPAPKPAAPSASPDVPIEGSTPPGTDGTG